MNPKKEFLYIILAGFFITNAIVAELIGSKLIYVGESVMSLGILPWPVVFVTTDLINEYFGKKGVKKITFLTTIFIAYTFILIYFGIKIPAATPISTVSDLQFNAVFGQSMWIIVGSIVAFLFSQLIDSVLFHFFKSRTKGKWLWLRSTGSTVISQLFDSFIVLGIAFWLTGILSTEVYIRSALTGYSVKLVIAIALTPLIYLGHFLIDRFLVEKKVNEDE